ncbi:MAG: ABC transporter ATP-binding protein [Syntrophotaleaceae bacterium]
MGRICVSNLGKAYKLYSSHWSRLLEWVVPFLGPRHEQKWVLQGINFLIKPGEAVGIVGINGAGKSTLLKLITGTTQPTTGNVETSGSVAAMLELGMGFHPEFTGRQNVFMAAQLLGMQVDEISKRLPEIEAFAEIGDYIDRQVRVYSSGMQMRLAFSVATAKRPDVLIVDEALSVGDAYFQHKSFNRIREFRKAGTTLLIVSHDKQAIQSICDRAILLDGGQLAMEGEPEAVMDYYNAMLAERGSQTVRQEKMTDGKTKTVSGSGGATVMDVGLLDEKGDKVEVINVGQRVTLRVIVDIHSDLPDLVVGYMIKDRLGQPAFGTNTYHLRKGLQHLGKGERVEYAFTFLANIGEGSYSISIALHTQDTHLAANYEWRDLALVFDVVNLNQDRFVGTAWLPPDVRCFR